MKRSTVIVALIVLVSASSAFAQESRDAETKPFAELKAGLGAGIICDDAGNMFVARDGAIARIDSSGAIHPFCDLRKLPKGKDYYFPSPTVWDMAFDAEGNIIAAAQDRVLRISPDGTAEAIIREDFAGFIGASGLALDASGCIYVTDGSRILKYGPDLKKEVFIDASGYRADIKFGSTSTKRPINSFLSLAFDPAMKNLYATDFDAKVLLRYPLDAKGRPGEPVIVLDPGALMLGEAPLNIVFGEKGSVFVSNDLSSRIIKIDAGGEVSFIKMKGGLMNHWIAFGGKGFDEESVYCTTYMGERIYRISVGEKAARRR